MYTMNYSTAQFKLNICTRVLVESREKFHELIMRILIEACTHCIKILSNVCVEQCLKVLVYVCDKANIY